MTRFVIRFAFFVAMLIVTASVSSAWFAEVESWKRAVLWALGVVYGAAVGVWHFCRAGSER